jgi:Tol biopolymer transport system component
LTFDKQNIIGLTWTQNGKEVIFSSDRDGDQRLWRIAVSGGTPEPVDAYGVQPTVSSQGHLLAYYQRIADPDIWRIDFAGKQGKATVPYKFIVSSRFDVAPLISPDQTKIVFASGRTGRAEIWRCDSSGRNLLQLTHLGSNDTSPGSPRWSPDSKFIAFDASREGQSDIYVISAEGGTPQRLTTEISEDFIPYWSWDGNSIYFTSNRSGNFQIWKMPVQGGSAKQVTTRGGYAAYESLDGKWVYYFKKPFDSIWKTPVPGGEESLVLDVSIEWGSVAFVREGFYYFDDKTGPASIKFFDFATQDTTTVTVLNDPLALHGISASLDRRRLLYSQRHFEGDIMLVENFR